MFIAMLWTILLALFNVFIPLLVSANDCGSHFVATHEPQEFTSPNYPNDYYNEDDSYNCKFTIKIEANLTEEVVVIKFNDFYLSSESGLMTVESGGKTFFIFSKQYQPNTNEDNEYVVGDEVIIELNDVSDNKPARFSITIYSAPIENKAEPLEPESHWLDLISPNFPNAHANTMKIYQVTGIDKAMPLIIQINDCHIQSDSSLIIVGDSTSQESKIYLGGECPEVLPYSFYITQNEALIVFHSIYNTKAKNGFKLRYRIMTDAQEP